MSQSLWVAVSDSGRVDGLHDTDWLRPHYPTLSLHHIPGKSPEGRVHIQLSVRRWNNAKTQAKLWLIGLIEC